MSNTVIKVEGLSKRYQLGTIGYGSLQHDLKAWWARARGKADPNAKIGEKSRLDTHGDFWALKEVGFQVQQGDRLGVMGRNGAGKSTLLKLLSRITSPTSGSIKIRGRIASLLEVGTGFHPELTGRENVFLNGAILGMKRREIQQKFDEIVGFAGVEQFIDTPVKRYSSGMYVRLAFSVAAHLDSEILIVDEVLAVGDAEFQKKCLGKMEQISKGEGRTIMLVSHYLGSLRSLCNTGLLLEKGKATVSGPIERVIDHYVPTDENLGFRPFRIDVLDLEVKNIRIGSDGGRVRPFERVQIQIDLEAGQALEGLGYQVILAPHDIPGRFFSSHSALNNNQVLRLEKGPNTLFCEIERFHLASGKYHLGFAVDVPEGQYYFYETDLMSFAVDEVVYPGGRLPSIPEYGRVFLPNKWSVQH